MKAIKINKAEKVDKESWGWGSTFNRVVRKDHAEKLIFEKRCEGCEGVNIGYLGKGVLGGGNSRYRSLEAGSQPRCYAFPFTCSLSSQQPGISVFYTHFTNEKNEPPLCWNNSQIDRK